MNNSFQLNGKLEITIPENEFLLMEVRTKHSMLNNFTAARLKVNKTLFLDLSKVKYIERFTYVDWGSSSHYLQYRNLPATYIHSESQYTSLRFVFKERANFDFNIFQDITELCIYQMGFPELETYRVKE